MEIYLHFRRGANFILTLNDPKRTVQFVIAYHHLSRPIIQVNPSVNIKRKSQRIMSSSRSKCLVNDPSEYHQPHTEHQKDNPRGLAASLVGWYGFFAGALGAELVALLAAFIAFRFSAPVTFFLPPPEDLAKAPGFDNETVGLGAGAALGFDAGAGVALGFGRALAGALLAVLGLEVDRGLLAVEALTCGFLA